jgi:hypothetical protein
MKRSKALMIDFHIIRVELSDKVFRFGEAVCTIACHRNSQIMQLEQGNCEDPSSFDNFLLCAQHWPRMYIRNLRLSSCRNS